LACRELVGQAGAPATAADWLGAAVETLPEAGGADGLAVTVVVTVAAGVLADDEQPATAARETNAAATTRYSVRERTGPGNTGLSFTGLPFTDLPFTRVTLSAPFANYDGDAGLPVGATPAGSGAGRHRSG
jgi:hypothetical protein